jgi:GxxExxY protein
MNENDLSYLIRGAAFKVYNALGPGLLESAYEAALAYELIDLKLQVSKQVPVPLVYNSVKLEAGYRIDLLVNNLVIIEIKSVENITEVHHKQVLTYLRLSALRLGLLINFNVNDISAGIFRKVNRL